MQHDQIAAHRLFPPLLRKGGGVMRHDQIAAHRLFPPLLRKGGGGSCSTIRSQRTGFSPSLSRSEGEGRGGVLPLLFLPDPGSRLPALHLRLPAFPDIRLEQMHQVGARIA
ncbi:hypothetical protein D3C81_1041480 [compost metagenome]